MRKLNLSAPSTKPLALGDQPPTRRTIRGSRTACLAAVVFAGVALAIAVPGVARAAPLLIEGRLEIVRTSGDECPPAARLAEVRMVLTHDTATSRIAGVMRIGDELLKSVEGAAGSVLALGDPLLDGDDVATANQLTLDAWPLPSRGSAAFQFFRLGCRVLEATVTDLRVVDASAAQAAAADAALAAAGMLLEIRKAGARGDPRPGVSGAPRAHAALARELGPRHAVTLEARYLQMLIAQDTGALDNANAIGTELRDAYSAVYGPNSGAVVRLRAAMALTLWRAGRREEAIEENGAALEALAAGAGTRGRFYNRQLQTRAAYLTRAGRPIEAIAPAREAEATARAEFGESSELRLEAATELATAYLVAQRQEDASALLRESLPLARSALGAEHPVHLQMLSIFVGTALDLGLHDEAADSTEFILAVRTRQLGPDNPATFSALVNHAKTLALRGQLEASRALLSAAYERPPRTGLRSEPLVTIELNLTTTLLSLGDLDGAGPMSEAAVRRTLEYYGADDIRTVRASLSRAEWLRRSARPAEALPLLDDALAKLERLPDPAIGDELQARAELASVQLSLGRSDAAVETLSRLVDQAEAHRSRARTEPGARRTLLSRWVADYRRLAALLVERGQTVSAFRLAELSKGRSLLDQISERSAQRAAGLGEDQRRALQSALDEIADLERQLAAAPRASAREAELATALSGSRSRYQQTRTAIADANPRYAALTRPELLDLPAAQRLLASDEVAVSYLLLPDRVIRFALDQQSATTTAVPLQERDRTNLRAFARLAGAGTDTSGELLWQLPDGRRVLEGARPHPQAEGIGLAQLSGELGALLLGGLEPVAAGKRRLLVSPDDLLAALPFESMSIDGAQVIDRFEVAYTQSLSVHARVLQRDAAGRPPGVRRTVLAVGAPTFATKPMRRGSAAAGPGPDEDGMRFRSAGVTWQPLPGARREVESIARLFPGAKLLVGDDAAEWRLQQMNATGELARYDTLHFATHAFFSSERADLSAIVLRQPGGEGTDGFLTVNELLLYRLDSRLTVLSACETARGRIVDGEGLMGFSYALFLAGNRGTIAALWNVPDGSTAVFMQHFFSALREGRSNAAALARAKRQVRADPRFRDPMHWAGFVLYGV